MVARRKAKPRRKKTPVSKARKRGKSIGKTSAVRKKAARKAPLRRASAKKAAKTPKSAKRAPVRPQPPAETVAPPLRLPRPVPAEQRIGVVTHYYSHLSVAALRLDPGSTLRVGDVIHVLGHTTDFTQRVESLEVDHKPVLEVAANDDFGLKVFQHAREHDDVFKVRS